MTDEGLVYWSTHLMIARPLTSRLAATLPWPLRKGPNVRDGMLDAHDLFRPSKASARRSQTAPYVAGGKDLAGPTVALEEPARAVLAVIYVMRRGELAKAMAGCNFNLTQAPA